MALPLWIFVTTEDQIKWNNKILRGAAEANTCNIRTSHIEWLYQICSKYYIGRRDFLELCARIKQIEMQGFYDKKYDTRLNMAFPLDKWIEFLSNNFKESNEI